MNITDGSDAVRKASAVFIEEVYLKEGLIKDHEMSFKAASELMIVSYCMLPFLHGQAACWKSANAFNFSHTIDPYQSVSQRAKTGRRTS